MTLEPGEMIEGKYRIVRLIGEGGMGPVYQGENARIHRKVAIKVLHAAVAAKAHVVQRFEREAQAAGRIGSEHIVEVLDLGTLASGERFMVMEYLDGESLGGRIKRKERMTPEECAPILHQLLEGLASAHEAGIVHCDLKPDNVYLVTGRRGQRDFVKVLDFGASKWNAMDNEMTKTGAVVGTPYYMSPEQARGQKVDHRSDLYSVGVVIYQAITGRLPFEAESFDELVSKIALEPPEPAEQVVPGLDLGFSVIITRAMTREIDQRFQTARDFQATVAQWMRTNPPPDLGGTKPALAGSRPGPPSGPSRAGSDPGLGPSSSPLAAGDPGLSPSSPPLAAGNLGLGASAPGVGQSSPRRAGSQTDLTVTTPQPRRGGALIFTVVSLLLVGGALGAYKILGAGAGRAPGATSAAVPPAEPPAAPRSQAPAPIAASSPTVKPAPAAAPSAALAAAPTATSVAPIRPPLGGGTPSGAPRPPTTPAQPAPKPIGRPIRSEL